MKITKPYQNSTLSILAYGESGSGKTPFAATLQDHEETSPALFISIEAGHGSILDRDIDMVEIEDWSDFDRIYQYLHAQNKLQKQGNDERLLELHNEFHQADDDEPTIYQGVAIDSFTEAQMMCKYDILGFDHAESLAQDPQDLQWEEWKKLKTRSKNMAVNFVKKLDLHVVFTALLSEGVDEKTGEKKRRPAMEGSASEEVPGVFDTVLCLKSVSDPERDEDTKFLAKERNGYFARDRVSRNQDRDVQIPPVSYDLTVPEIYEIYYRE